MIITIVGLIGVGKTTIAQEISRQLSIPYYSIDDDKKKIYPAHPRYTHFIKNDIPFPDEVRKKTFDKSLQGLCALAKHHKNIIVEETFHKKKLARTLF